MVLLSHDYHPLVPKRPEDEPLPPGGMVRKTAFLTPEEAAALKVLAEMTERSESDLMREGFQLEKARVLEAMPSEERELYKRLLNRKLGG